MQNLLEQSHVYPWQQTVWETLTRRFPELGHGLLLYGKPGCGKEAFARKFLAWILCQHQQPHGPCGECSSCQWLKSDTHPNYVHISTDEDNKKANAKIRIEKIRDLLPFVQQTVEGWRVVVIEPAEALNTAAANALLKTLEEPGDRIVIILLAEHYLKLPATVRSRLQHYALDRVTLQQADTYISSHLAGSDQQSWPLQLLMNLANDMPLKAVELAQSVWLPQRAEFLNDWDKLVTQKNMPLFFASKWQKELAFTDFIHMFEYLLCDIICVKLNQSRKNIDLDVRPLTEQYSLEALFDIYSTLQQSKRLTEQNVQTNLILDQLFIQLMNV